MVGVLLVSSPLAAQEGTPREPSIRFGNLLDIEPRATLQTEWRRFDGQPASRGSVVELRRARIGIEGRVFRHVEYQVERDLHETSTPWADVYANVTFPRGVGLRAGHFKVPFSLERLTAAAELDFAYRSLTADYLAPGREIGAMVHGKALGNRLRYQAGLFRGGGDNVRSSERDASSRSRLMGGRLVVRPWDGARASVASKLAVGLSLTSGRLPQGPNSIRVHTFADDPLAHEVFVNGQRRRIGGEVEWRFRSMSLRGERVHVSEQRLGEGTDDDDLPHATANGWYLSGTWLITGEKKSDRVRPSRSVPQGGRGAVEVTARIEGVRFGSIVTDAPASRDSRARTIAGDADRAVTVGVNWYATRAIKLQLNWVREEITRQGVVGNSPSPGWNPVVRLQFTL